MRISEVQNFALNSLNKCCKPRKSNENISSNNSLERSPMMDTVSFGRFGGRYAELTKDYAWMHLLKNITAYDILNKTIYLSVEPTKETVLDPTNNVYEAKLVDYREFRPDDKEIYIKQMNQLMERRVEDFNNMYGYESGWEKHLTTTEDFEKAARLANYLDNHGLFSDSGDDDEEGYRMFGIRHF